MFELNNRYEIRFKVRFNESFYGIPVGFDNISGIKNLLSGEIME
jgi:hypothetical protein